MKKLLALLLTLLLTFGCFSLALTGTAMAEEQTAGQIIMQSDFNDSDGTNWISSYPAANNVVYGDNDGDGVNDYARVNSSSAKKGIGFLSTPFELIPGNEYELSFSMRIPEGSKNYLIGGSTFFTPTFTFYETETNTNDIGTKVSSIPKKSDTEAENNYYAYSKSGCDWTRRSGFTAEWKIGDYEAYTTTGFSTLTYTNQKTILGATTDAKTVFADWTTVTAKFTAFADEAGETSQTTALGFHFLDLDKVDGYMFDLKDVSLTCTKASDNFSTTTILESNFDTDTKWQYYKTTNGFATENDEAYARINSSATNKNAALLSEPFSLVPGNQYELSFYIRVPEDSVSFMYNGTTFVAPTINIYECEKGSTGRANIQSKISATESDNNIYAYSYTDDDTTDDDGDTSWKRRSGFSAIWEVEGYDPYTVSNFSVFAGIQQKNVFGSTTDVKTVYASWTKITAKFTAIASSTNATAQTAAVSFGYNGVNVDGFMFDIKDVTLTEKAPIINAEPDTTDAIFYEGFEELEDPTTVVNAMSGQSFVDIAINSGDAATGLKSCSVFGMYQHIYIPFDKTKLEADTVYTYSMDWKLLKYTDTKKRNIEKLYLVGYNPADGTFKDNYYALAGDANTKKGTGNWETTSFNFKISEDKFAAYEQFGIYILYKTSTPYTNAEDTLYIDTLMLKVSDNQDIVTELDLNTEDEDENTIKVLAFGNSFSNDGTSFIPQIAKADGVDIRVADCSIGGCSLSKHCDNAVTNATDYNFYYRTPHATDKYTQHFNSVSMEQALTANDWDYISIQQVSTLSGLPDEFEPHLEYLVGKFKEVCPDAKIVLQLTWAYQDGITKEGYEKYNNSQTNMYNAILSTYAQYAKKYDVEFVIPSGVAVQTLRGQVSDTLFATEKELEFTRDGFHLSNKGRIAAALTWYETLTGISAEETEIDLTTSAYATYTDTYFEEGDLVEISPDEATAIKKAAHDAVAMYNIAGDVDLDNQKSDIEDVTLLAKHFAGWDVAEDIYLTAADVDGNGKLNLYDLVKLAQIAADWPN